MGMLMRRHYPKREATEATEATEAGAEGEATKTEAVTEPDRGTETGQVDEPTTEATEAGAEGEAPESGNSGPKRRKT